MLKFVLVSTAIDLEFIPYQELRLLKNWTMWLRWVFQFVGSELYNIVDKMFLLPPFTEGGLCMVSRLELAAPRNKWKATPTNFG